MADNYNSDLVSDMNEENPTDLDSIGTLGKAIRQIKRILKLDTGLGGGYVNWLKESSLKTFIDERIQEKFRSFYRVGDIIFTTNTEDPSSLFGGIWEELPTEYVRNVGVGATDLIGTTINGQLKYGTRYFYVGTSGERAEVIIPTDEYGDSTLNSGGLTTLYPPSYNAIAWRKVSD